MTKMSVPIRQAEPPLLKQPPDPLTVALFETARTVKLAPEQVLFMAGDPGDGCYLVDQGLLKVTMGSASGTERILAILGAGAILGELSMIDGEPRAASVTALRDSELRFVSRVNFHTICDGNPQVCLQIMTLLAKRLRDTNSVVAASSFLTLKGRVARALIGLAEAFGHDVGQGRILIRQKMSQSDLAAMAGIARENVSRILNEWKRDAIVSRVSAYYCLENRAALAKEAEL